MARQTLSLPFDPALLRMARERAGLNIQGLADRCRDVGHPVHASYLGKIERGLYRPSAPLLKGLAAALDIEVDGLLADEVVAS